MATLTTTSPRGTYPSGYDYTPSLGELFYLEDAQSLGGSSTMLSFKLTNGAVVRISGSGFAYDSEGIPVAGTVSLIRLYLGHSSVPLHALSGLSLPLVSVMDQAEANWANSWLLQDWLLNGNDTIDGRSSVDAELYGSRGNDTFLAGNGSYMEGGQGKDTYTGGKGFDTLSFQDAHWDPTAFQGVVANLATGKATDAWGNAETFSGIEEVRGTQFADSFTGSSAKHEQFMGLGGRDVINGGGGFDVVRHDHDALRGGLRGVTVDLAAGYAIDGFARRDTLVGIEGAVGTEFDDKLYGSSAANKLYGMDGDDILDGRGGADELYGGYGHDTYYVDNVGDKVIDVSDDEYVGMNSLYSTVDVDLGNTNRFQGDIGNVHLVGTARKVIGSANSDDISGNGQNNFIDGRGGDDTIRGADGDDALNGGDGDDWLGGQEGSDKLNGGGGDDQLNGGKDSDTLIGGTGIDAAVYAGSRSLVASLANPEKNTEDAKGDIYISIENLYGGLGADKLEGDGRANVLDGGAGRDTLTGGGGADTFRFSGGHTGNHVIGFEGLPDTITDFVAGVDSIELRQGAFKALSDGPLDGSRFTANTTGTATSSSQRIIYETDTGRLRYDTDGSGSTPGMLFVVLTPNLAITHEDFFVY
jgi:Ca2+-binding RTX toxin-like protein